MRIKEGDLHSLSAMLLGQGKCLVADLDALLPCIRVVSLLFKTVLASLPVSYMLFSFTS